VAVGAQDAFWKESGAYTGQVSPGMLKAVGVQYVILGHSETRGRYGVAEPDFTDVVLAHFGESDETVNRKTKAVLAQGLVPIVCIGETLAEREQGVTDSVIDTQVRGALAGIDSDAVSGLVLAYEPVWAIGTGKTCDAAEADRVCGVVRASVAAVAGDAAASSVRIQYGGSMKPDNAAELLGMPNIDGGLIGGASLKAGDFAAIVAAAK
jgi:triosephosphate isomerase